MKNRLVMRVALLVITATGTVHAHGDLHERISRLTVEIRDSPSADLYFRRGCLHLEHGDAEAALEDFRETDRLAPGAFETGPPRAEGCMLLGKYPLALEFLNRCLEHDPSATRCLVLRARVFLHLGKSEAAIQDFRKALSFAAEPEPDLLLEVSAALAKNKQASEALEIIDHGIARLGSLPSLVIPAIELELANGNPEGALRRIDIMRKAAPRPEPWMARRASVLARAGRLGESRDAWRSLLDHISSLPPGEQTSHAMCASAREAREALAALESNPQ